MDSDKNKSVRFSPKLSKADKEESKATSKKLSQETSSVDSAVPFVEKHEPRQPNHFSALRGDIKQSCPDKPSSHDIHFSEELPSPLHTGLDTYFVETIVNPDEKVRPVPVTEAILKKSPPTLDHLIKQLEIEHFGKELEDMNVDEMFSPRSDGELKELTERLHSYIKRMRELRNGAPNLDVHNFFKSVDSMEREMKNLKNMYEKEIAKLRQHLDDLTRQKNLLQLQNSKLEATASDLQIRMAAETDTARRLNEDMATLQGTIHQKEQEYQTYVQGSMDTRTTSTSVNETNRKLDQTLRENLDLQHRYESELLQRRENEDKVHQLQEQIAFTEELNKQQQQDLQDRLAAANTAILNLEGKVRVLHRPDHEVHIGEMLSSVRDAAERELYKYKQDAEEMFAKNMTMLKSQMDADRKAFEAVSDENRKLLGVIEELNTKIRNLQGEIIHVEHMKRSTEENIVMERDRATRHIQAMEGKLKDLQDMLFDKMKELNAARIQNLPLKAEVESLRALIDEEEKRLAMDMKLPPLSYTVTRSPEATKRMSASSMADLAAPSHADSPTLSMPSMKRLNITELPGGGPMYTPDATTCTQPIHMDPATRPEPTRPLSSSAKLVGPVRPKSSQGEDMGTQVYPVHEPIVTAESAMYYGQGSSEDVKVDERSVRSGADLATVTAHDYNHCTNSATGDVRVHEVHPDGKGVTLANLGDQELDFGGHMIQQQVGGNPVAVFRFPPKTIFSGKSYITVFSGCNDTILHQPSTQFVWIDQDKWGTGPECTTILCKPNGQAIAWTTAAHRFGSAKASHSSRSDSPLASELPLYTNNPNSPPSETLFLKREKETPPSLAAQRHPHGNVHSQAHPQCNEKRAKDLGNDNSSNHRQTRSQSSVPDRVPGEPYAGVAGQRMGSSTMRRYTPLTATSGSIRKNGAIANRVKSTPRGRHVTSLAILKDQQIHKDSDFCATSETPNPFMTPKNRYKFGLEQVQSQHHTDFNPPMPRPPFFSSW